MQMQNAFRIILYSILSVRSEFSLNNCTFVWRWSVVVSNVCVGFHYYFFFVVPLCDVVSAY